MTKPMITLLCPLCGKSMPSPLDKTDPPNTARVETLCYDCDDGGNFPEVLYFDKNGKQLECE